MAIREEFFFRSSDGDHQVHAVRWLPEDGAPKAVVQLVHGIAEYIGRYDPFASYLTEQGFAVVGHDHLGHGQTARKGRREFGFLAERDGWSCLVQDVHTLRQRTGGEFPGLPYFLLGHSMGSFVARTYLIDHPGSVDGCLLSGTGQESAALVALGKGVSSLYIRLKGPRHISRLITFLSLGVYNLKFRPNRTLADWISRDRAVVDAYVSDPLCRFVPTVGMFRDMMGGLQYISSPEHLARMDPGTPVGLFSGEDDPVGGRGRGVRKVAEYFRSVGCQDLTVKLYPGGRHEILNEINRDEVYRDLSAWLDAHLAAKPIECSAALSDGRRAYAKAL